MQIRLSEFECHVAIALGRYRQARADRLRVENHNLSVDTDVEIHIQGAGAEIALCRALNVYPELDSNGCALPDARLGKLTIDVKQTKYENGRLLCTTRKRAAEEKICDAYVLVTGEVPYFIIRGWYPSNLLFKDTNIQDLGHGPTYCKAQYELFPIQSLKEYDNERH